jgi:hypothetical protein
MPERWETAVEDFAQLVALGLDRAQDLADVIGDVNRAKPAWTNVVVAAAGGALIGVFLANRIRRRPPSKRERARRAAVVMAQLAAQRASTIEQQAAAVAQAAAQRLAERAASASDARDRLPRVDGSDLQSRASAIRSAARTRLRRPDIGRTQVGDVAKVVSVVVALLRNPLVRAMLWGAAARLAAKR